MWSFIGVLIGCLAHELLMSFWRTPYSIFASTVSFGFNCNFSSSQFTVHISTIAFFSIVCKRSQTDNRKIVILNFVNQGTFSNNNNDNNNNNNNNNNIIIIIIIIIFNFLMKNINFIKTLQYLLTKFKRLKEHLSNY